MLTGWTPGFLFDRELSTQELACNLSMCETASFGSDDMYGMAKFNAVYMEFVNRTFKIKGMLATLLLTIGGLLALGVSVHAIWVSLGSLREISDWLAMLLLLSVSVSCVVMFWCIHLRKDLFQYTHYPIRFNRITRKIYFFRHNGPGGVVVVPWGSPFAFFHIGRGGQDPNLRDLRCHLLDRNRQVQQTFTIGHFWDHDQDIREQWALICRYMQEGPETCFDDPLDRVITLSTLPTFRNHWMLVCLMMGTNLFPFRHNLLFPFYGALTLSRWLTFKTCKAPVFPPEIEAECAIAPDDPYALPEPRFMAEFASDPAIYERARKRYLEKIMWR